MGLLDIAQGLLGGSQTSGAGDMLGTVVQALNGQAGGLDGILQSLQSGGLQEAVTSWIGTGQNARVTGEQLQSVLGSGLVGDLASKLGISPTDASSRLSELLPGIVDHLTPNGEVPQGGFAGAGMDLVKGLLSRSFGALEDPLRQSHWTQASHISFVQSSPACLFASVIKERLIGRM